MVSFDEPPLKVAKWRVRLGLSEEYHPQEVYPCGYRKWREVYDCWLLDCVHKRNVNGDGGYYFGEQNWELDCERAPYLHLPTWEMLCEIVWNRRRDDALTTCRLGSHIGPWPEICGCWAGNRHDLIDAEYNRPPYARNQPPPIYWCYADLAAHEKDQERRGEWDCYYDVACRLEKVLRKKSTPGLSPTMGPTGSGGEDLAGPGLSCAGAAVAIRKHV